jgi:glyoxylate carboligase
MTKEEMREITKNTLDFELVKILNNYMKIYDEYYETYSRDSAFLKDLVDSLIGISSVLEVYVDHKGINSGYAIEKLENSKSYIESNISYFKSKMEEENE